MHWFLRSSSSHVCPCLGPGICCSLFVFSMFPYNCGVTLLRRSLNLLRFATWAVRRTGPLATGRWILATAQFNLRMASPSTVKVQPRFLEFPITLRAMTSDPFVYRQIMIENEYAPAPQRIEHKWSASDQIESDRGSL